jgi:hypothetical protein
MKKQQQAAEEQQRKKEDILATWAQQNPAAYSQFLKAPKEEREAMLQQAMAGMGGMQ